MILSTHEKIDDQVYFEILQEGGGCCGYCGGPLDDKTVMIDYKIPASIGGAATKENLLAACKPCIKLKGHKSIEEFRAYVFENIVELIDKAWDAYQKTGHLMNDQVGEEVRAILQLAKRSLRKKALANELTFFSKCKKKGLSWMSAILTR
jgi:hypothetical protein